MNSILESQCGLGQIAQPFWTSSDSKIPTKLLFTSKIQSMNSLNTENMYAKLKQGIHSIAKRILVNERNTLFKHSTLY